MGICRSALGAALPVLGVAILLCISEEPSLLVTLTAVPALLALPLLAWSTLQAGKGSRNGMAPGILPTAAFLGALLLLGAGPALDLLLESALGHGGTPRGLLPRKLLFAFTLMLLSPGLEWFQMRAWCAAGEGGRRRIRRRADVLGGILLVIAGLLLAGIIGPPLNFVMRFRHRGTARFLIQSGADVNRLDRWKASPLLYAVLRTDPELARLLLDRGAILVPDTAGLGLARAVETRNLEMLRLLLGRGAKADEPYMGASALLRACQQGELELARTLLAAGADPRAKARYPNMPYDGKTPVDTARERGDPRVLELIRAAAGE